MKWLYVTGRSQRRRLAEKKREREMDSEGEAGSLTDGLTGSTAGLDGWLLLSGQKRTEALSRHKHAISGGSFNQ